MVPRFRFARRVAIGLALSWVVAAPAAWGNPVAGFVEDWPTGFAGWNGTGITTSNPGTGGVGGAGDGYLEFSKATPGRFGVHVGNGVPYSGNWTAANIVQVRLYLNDIGAADAFEIHFSIGLAQNNFWQYNEAFVPLHNTWKEFIVDLTDETKFTQIIGTGTFSAMLQNVDTVHLRHDQAPYQHTPDSMAGDLGVDRLQLLNPAMTPVRLSSWGRIKNLYHGGVR